MDITFFYTKNQLEKFLNSRFSSTILCSQKDKKIGVANEDNQNLNLSSLLSPKLESILEQIVETKKIIDPMIKRYIMGVENSELFSILNYSGGFSSWREKSLLIRLSIHALGLPFKEPLIKCATAIELFGMSACLLDDFIDEATFYDLKKTTWLKFGSKETICAYEVLTSLATKVLIDGCKDAQIAMRDFEDIMYVFVNIKYDTYVSQFIDIKSKSIPDFSEANYFEMISKFPGTLYGGALQIATMLSGMKGIEVNALKEFGRLFGMANQIRDDLIEIIGEEEVIGKKIGADILQKKKRLPLILLLQSNNRYAKLFQELELNEELLQRILSEINSNEIVTTCINCIRNLVERAIFKLNSLPKNRWRELLRILTLQLAEFDEQILEVSN